MSILPHDKWLMIYEPFDLFLVIMQISGAKIGRISVMPSTSIKMTINNGIKILIFDLMVLLFSIYILDFLLPNHNK